MYQRINSIDYDYHGNYRGRRAALMKLENALEFMDSEYIEKVDYHVHVHEPAAYNNWEKQKVYILDVKLRVPDYKERDGFGGKSYKSRSILFNGFRLRPLWKHFKGFKFSGVSFYEHEGDGKPRIIASFERQVKA